MLDNLEYSELSYKLTKNITKKTKKNNGIYFTPPETIRNNLECIKPYINNIKNILEPSCGSCEYILALNKKFPNINITGIEKNEIIFDSIKHLFDDNDKINITKCDFLEFDDGKKYDLIIGNPPFFVMTKKDVDEKYYKYFDGRPNIFILFIIKALDMLNDNGILSFVLPKSFINCIYYDKTRKFIDNSCTIIDIIKCDDKYIETQQDTIIMIIKNTPSETNSKFTININNHTIFGNSDDIEEINSLYENSKSLFDLGFSVKVGNVVWNQCKDILTDDKSKTRLIYSSNIENNKLVIKTFKNPEKKNFINKTGQNNPTLIVNRGYGVGKYKFEYCLIDGNDEYLLENHVISINYKEKIDNSELIKLYKKIIKSFEDTRTKEFIKLYFGNSAISTTELNYILPIYGINI